VSLTGTGLPYMLVVPLAIVAAGLVGFALEKFAVEPARSASVVTLIIITIGASIFCADWRCWCGTKTCARSNHFRAMRRFRSPAPRSHRKACGCSASLRRARAVWFSAVRCWGRRFRLHNRLAATGRINVRMVLFLSFGLSAALGAVAGILIAPITLTSYDVGVMLGLKGFAAAILGGLGSGIGAVIGGLVLGIAETMSAGYLSSAYKDAIAFVIILAVLFFMPSGLFGKRGGERV
jgi:branched-chain amino acid transport system permease protein